MGSRITGYRRDNFAKALLLSLALHALVLSLQFGDSDSGLPRFGMPEESRIASIPMLNAVLHSQEVVGKSLPEQLAQAVVSSSEKPVAASLAREAPSPNLPPEPVTASITKLETRPPDPVEKRPVAAVAAEAPKIIAPAADVAVLSTDKESTWSRPVGGDETLNKQEDIEQKKVTPAPEQNMVEEQARIEEEKATQTAAAREKELALERKQAEEQAHLEAMKAEQAAAARAREEVALSRQREAEKLTAEKAAKDAAENKLAEQRKMAEEQARIEEEKAAQAAAAREKELALERKRVEEQARLEAMKAEQAAAARVRAEVAKVQQAEAEKLAAEKAAQDAAGKILAEQQSRLSNTGTGKPDGGNESGNGTTAGPTVGKGSELARRAIDAIRGGQIGLPGIESAEPARPRRGSILGRNPKDIQLAFYGEGWRLKIERIGSLNYPTLSRNLAYDPLVATVSINSDGTLAGVRVVKSSGHKDLDEAVLRIVTMSAPFSPFPPDMKRMYDVVDLTRTWVFLDNRPTITSE